jgi:arylsulfatase
MQFKKTMSFRFKKMLAVLAVLVVTSANAQTSPDFSGRWVIPPERGRGARGASQGSPGSGWGSEITIAQDAKNLIVEYVFFGPGDMQPPLKFVYALDGSETKNRVMMGRGIEERVSKTAWDGNKLVITTSFAFPDPVTGKSTTTDMKQILSLETPTSLLVETTRSAYGGGAATITKTTYTKM